MKPTLLLLLFTAALLGGAAPRAAPADTKRQQIPADFMTPLMHAAAAGRVDEVSKLLRAGANVNEKIPELGLTALMLAAGRGHLEVVKLLLKAGADPNAAGGVAHVGFYTPLTMAMERRNQNRLEVIDALIGGGARLNPRVPFPQSPLGAAVEKNDIEMIRALLKRGSDVNWENEVGNTALVTAITLGEPSVDVVKLLLDAGADPNKPRLWIGDECMSILTSLDERETMSPDEVTKEMRRLIVQAGGKRYTQNAHGGPCKSSTRRSGRREH
jgi:ankyrin repeat protein